MRPTLAEQALIAVLSLSTFGSALPFIDGSSGLFVNFYLRSHYSVVPVDGGPAATGDNNSQQDLPSPTTLTTIQVASTQTTVETDLITLPPVTDFSTSTLTIQGPTITQTSEITIIPPPSPTTITKTSYSIIDVSAPPITSTVFTEAPHSSSSEVAPTSTSSDSASSTVDGPANSATSDPSSISEPTNTPPESSSSGYSPEPSTSLITSTITSSPVGNFTISSPIPSTVPSSQFTQTYITNSSVSVFPTSYTSSMPTNVYVADLNSGVR